MNKVYFDKEGTEAEILCAVQFNGRITQQLEHQYKDIDLFIKSKEGTWKSCSVKDQLRGTSRGFTSVQIELVLEDTDTGEQVEGCFYKNETDWYVWRVQYKGEESWCFIETKKLKSFVEQNIETLKPWQTMPNTNKKNKEYGRKYNKASGVELELSDMACLGTFIPVRRTIH